METPEASEAPHQYVTKLAEPAQEQDQPKTLRDVVPIWERRTSAKPDAKNRTKRALELFEQAVGVAPERSDQGCRRPLCGLPAGHRGPRGFIAKTAHSYASAINALVNIAVKVDWIEINSFDLSFDKTVGSEKRTPYR
ncbi:hypothetical protein PI87_20895 [Ralstonia sp. A12]|uniref:hypothetical protein n=1 Tax=Ralstonia sp. A12 TaxID=1217052 RepID=UPI00057557D9|nr:hypothetical protein [Ralstonia sp. A12]KHK51617.1 hypothetical protein PI87_20895 [Ralstonia sp. A12]